MPTFVSRADYKTMFGIATVEDDARIDLLIDSVTGEIQSFTGRTLFAGTFSEFLDGGSSDTLRLKETPIKLSGPTPQVWATSSAPRIYDSTTLLVFGTDYLIDGALLRRFNGVWPDGFQTVKSTYDGAYATIPTLLQRAAAEIVDVKLKKAKGSLYHVLSENRGDGLLNLGGSSSPTNPYDWPIGALKVIEQFRVRGVA